MQRRNREINIFNMSALDLFASALGAFIMLFAILMPYYLKTSKIVMQENAELKTQISECKGEVSDLRNSISQYQDQVRNLEQSLRTCEEEKLELQSKITEIEKETTEEQSKLQKALQENAELKRKNEAFQDRLSKTFLAVVMKWPTVNVDIDLYVKDPSGNVFYYEKKRFPGTQAELSVDTTKGPGIEIWEHPSAVPGKYFVSYKLYLKSPKATPTTVTGSIYFREGSKKMREIQLDERGEEKQVAIITVTATGDVTVE